MTKLLGSLLHEERLRKLHHCVPVFKEWLLRWRFPFHKESYGKVRSDACKLCLGRFQLDTGGKLFTMRIISHWSNLSIMREAVDSPTLNTTIQLARVMRHLIQTVLLPAKIGPEDP